MKCVIGVDLEKHCSSAISLLGRLQFSRMECVLVHIVEPISLTMPYSAYGMLVETDQIFDTLREAGQTVLATTLEDARNAGLPASTKVFDGYPSTSLVDFANDEKAQLVAVTSTNRSSLGAILGGSVARSLAIHSRQSVLIARNQPDAEPIGDRPLRAVFATDQSGYCEACMHLFKQFGPKGIGHITVLTVHDQAHQESILSLFPTYDVANAVESVNTVMKDKAAKIAHYFSDMGICSNSLVVAGDVEAVIREVMNDTKSDLLILGSQGHGFIDRLMAGSTAIHEVIAEPYPVLLLRPGKMQD